MAGASLKEAKVSFGESQTEPRDPRLSVLISDRVQILPEIDEGLPKQGFRVIRQYDLSKQDLIRTIQEKQVGVLVVRSETKVDREVFDVCPSLTLVVRAGEGYNNIDVEAASERSVKVANTPGKNTIAAAEHTIGMILSAFRQTTEADGELKNGIWNRSHEGVEINGKTIGVIGGGGKIGTEVIKRLLPFGPEKIVVYDPFLSKDKARQMGVVLAETLVDLLSVCDATTIHVPVTKNTRGMIGPEEVALMKKGSFFINVARGELVSEEGERALADAVATGRIRGVAIDVWRKEPATVDNSPILALDEEAKKKIVVTPHLGASTEESQNRVGLSVAEQIIANALGQPLEGSVNEVYYSPEEMEKMQPYSTLVSRLTFLAQRLGPKNVNKISISLSGEEVADLKQGPLEIAALNGYVSEASAIQVNSLNFRHVANSRGVKTEIQSTREVDDGATNMVEVKLSNEDGEEMAISASIGHRGRDQRIIEIDGYRVDIGLNGGNNLLILKNEDRKGMVGRVGAVFEEQDINVATMTVSRKEKGKDATMVIVPDTDLDDSQLEKVRTIPGVLSAQFVKLS